MIQAPKLLILDNPFDGLDTTSREVLKHAITGFSKTGDPQILLVTSCPEEIPPSVTHLTGVAHFQVVIQGTRDQVLQSEFVQEYFSPAENISPASSGAFPDYPSKPVAQNSILIEMKQISISYNRVKVLSGINWTMRQAP
jgi:molybdate transport system ATP-binding protein